MNEFQTVEVLGCPLAVLDYRQAYEVALDWAERSDRVYLVEAANTHVVAKTRHEKDFGQSMARFDLWLPDGMPLVWSINRKLPAERQLGDRVYGPTFMLRAFEWSDTEKCPSHFLLGGSEETLEKLEANLRSQYPGAQIAGSYSPPFGEWSEEENEKIVEKIRSSGAGFVWVGLGCPKQENWMARMSEKLPPAVYFGIGAAFAFHAGSVRQAPRVLQKLGLEWLFRLCCEPRRLFRRYFVYNSLFLWYTFTGGERSSFRLLDMKWVLVVLLSLGYLWLGVIGAGSKMVFQWPALFVFGGVAILAGLAVRSLDERSARVPMITTIVCAAYFLARAYLSPIPYNARFDILIILSCLIVYLLVSSVITEFRQRLGIVVTFIVIAFGNVIVAIYQFVADPSFHILPGYSRQNALLGKFGSGFYYTHTHMAGLIEVVAVMSFALAAFSKLGDKLRVFFVFSGIVCLGGLGISMSRGAFLSAGAGLLVLVIIAVVRAGFLGRLGVKRQVAAIAFSLLLIVVPSLLWSAKMLTDRYDREAGAENLVEIFEVSRQNVRFTNWSVGIKQWKLSPIIGTGSRTYDPYSIKLWPASTNRVHGHPVFAHNEYVQVLGDYGLVGLLLIVSCVLAHMIRGCLLLIRRFRREQIQMGSSVDPRTGLVVGSLVTFVVTGIHAIFDFHLHLNANAVPVAFAAAVLCNPGNVSGRKGDATGRGKLWKTLFTRVALLGCGSLLLILGIRYARADWLAEKLTQAMSQEETGKALQYGEKALKADPKNYVAARDMGYARLRLARELDIPAVSKGLIEKARESFESGLEANPMDFHCMTGVGRTLEREGKYPEALEAYSKAIEWGPFEVDPLTRYGYTELYLGEERLQVGAVVEAIKWGESAAKSFQRAIDANTRVAVEEGYAIKGQARVREFLSDAFALRGSVERYKGEQLIEEGKKREAYDILVDAETSFRRSMQYDDSKAKSALGAYERTNVDLIPKIRSKLGLD